MNDAFSSRFALQSQFNISRKQKGIVTSHMHAYTFGPHNIGNAGTH